MDAFAYNSQTPGEQVHKEIVLLHIYTFFDIRYVFYYYSGKKY